MYAILRYCPNATNDRYDPNDSTIAPYRAAITFRYYSSSDYSNQVHPWQQFNV